VFVLQRGELPVLKRPQQAIRLPQIGPSIEFPMFRLPMRDATTASPPGALFAKDGKTPGDDLDAGMPGVDYRWEHIVTVFDAQGNLIEDWTQWDKLFRRPHAVYISPYDPEKNVWIVDDYRHAIFRFSHDGKKLLQTIGEPNVPGTDDKHFYRPTFMAWLPDGTFFVADGYQNTRVVKFDKTGKFLMTWGQRGEAGKEKRPAYFNNVHGVAVDPQTRRVFVNDRGNGRVQVFDENGKFLDEWSFGPRPVSDIHMFIITSDRFLWAADRGTSKLLKYSLDGKFLYSWGVWGDFQGGFWGVHGMSVDPDGNVYTAAVDSGGAQKFTPRKGANPAFMLGKQVNPGWK
jgi:peptidylamidoglycolate lyase